MINIVIKWRDVGSTDWNVYDVADLKDKTVQFACYLFHSYGSVEVVAKQGDWYIVNNDRLRDSYKKNRKKVKTLEDVLASSIDLEQPFAVVGFGVV